MLKSAAGGRGDAAAGVGLLGLREGWQRGERGLEGGWEDTPGRSTEEKQEERPCD